MENTDNKTEIVPAEETQGAAPNEETQGSAPAPSGEKRKRGGVTARKVLRLIPEICLYVFLAAALLLLVISLVSRKDADGAVNLFGREMRIVVSSSMEKSEYGPDVSDYKIKNIKVKSMVFIERVPSDTEKAAAWYAKLEAGDVLTFRYAMGTRQETITHRLVEITPTDNGYVLKLQGDNRAGEGVVVATQTVYTSAADYKTTSDNYNYVIGKVTGQSRVLGLVVYALRSPVGMALIIIIPCALIIIWQVIRIVSVFGEERRKKLAAEVEEAKKTAESEARERERRDEELAALREKIAAMEREKADAEQGVEREVSHDEWNA